MEGNKDNERKEIFSERVRAGKRTYFFDVKATRSNDYYLTITESKRRYNDDGYTYEKHKIFLYKEDFNKFMKALNSTVDHVKEELLPDVDFDKFDRDREEAIAALENGNSTSNQEGKTDTTVDTPTTENTPTSEDVPATEDARVSEDTPTIEDTPATEEGTEVESELKWD